MTDRAFLAAIIAAPDDDGPRLAFADALELGDAGFPADPERAEFIRVQCEINRLEWTECTYNGGRWPHPLPARCVLPDGCGKCATIDALRKRERELLLAASTDPRATWRDTDGIPGESWLPGDWPISTTRGRWTWTRGFVSSIILPWRDWQAHSAALLAACPIANARDGCVRLTTWPDLRLFEIAGQPMALIHGTDKAVRVNSIEEAEGDRRTLILGLLGAIWNGVQFELPQ